MIACLAGELAKAFAFGSQYQSKRRAELDRGEIGVAFGGGAAKGFAHIGVLRELEEAGYPVNRIAGSSVGAAIAGIYAMSRDGLFFKAASKLHPRYKTPVAALVLQGIWTCLLCISGSYSQLLDYIICTELIFYIMTIGSLFVLRRKKPDAHRPYKALGYPVLPALYIVMAAWICIVLLRYKPQYTWPGIVIVLLGLPVYAIWSRKTHRGATT